MDRKKLILLVVALAIAVGTAFAARNMFLGATAAEANATAPEPTGPRVLVAQRAMPVGTIITADAVGFQLWPEELVRDAYYIDGEADMAALIGTVVRNPITAGEPITQGSLVAPEDRGFLAAALGPGMRAVTVEVSERTGVGGFVFPGDRVDLVLTQTVSGDEGQDLNASETVVRNVRVLATDRSTTQETEDGQTVVRPFQTVTLEATPRIAEIIAVSQTIGTLSLSLRSLADNQSDLERAVASGEVRVPEGASPEEEERILRAAMSRPSATRGSFVTGGDVSRFQRSSMPRADSGSSGSTMSSAVASVATASAPPPTPPAPTGPVIRVSRGNETTDVEVTN